MRYRALSVTKVGARQQADLLRRFRVGNTRRVSGPCAGVFSTAAHDPRRFSATRFAIDCFTKSLASPTRLGYAGNGQLILFSTVSIL
jgi:hypothetical protein